MKVLANSSILTVALFLLTNFNSYSCSRKMTLLELVQQSEAIVECTVNNSHVSWNPQRTLLTTQYDISIHDVWLGNLNPDAFELSFAGGRLGEVHHGICSMPELKSNTRYVLFIQSVESKTFCPITGWQQGIALVSAENGELLRPDGTPYLDEDQRQLDIPRLRAYVVANAPSVPYEFQFPESKGNYPSKEFRKGAESGNRPTSAPKKQPKPESFNLIPTEQLHRTDMVQDEPSTTNSVERWEYQHRALSVPIVFEPLPSSWTWSPYDQYQLSHWNSYSNIYQVYTQPDGYWGNQNGEYELVGWPDSNTMWSEFNYTWDPNTYAVCFNTWNGQGWGIEADIANNPAWNWTTDEFSIYGSSGLVNFQQTTLHEVGHSWGLQHQFNTLSVMNYHQTEYRVYSKTYLDDVDAIRSAFQNNGTNTNNVDLAVSLHVENGYQYFKDSQLSSYSISAGSQFTVYDFVIENLGTSTVNTPKVEWYLATELFNNSSILYHIGQTTHSELSSHHRFITERTLSIPSTVSTGYYYLVAQVNQSNDAVWINDRSWLDSPIWVTNNGNISVESVETEQSVVIQNDVAINGTVRVQVQNNMVGTCHFKMFDAAGNLVEHSSLVQGDNSVKCNHLSNGFYTCQVLTENQVLTSKKFVVVGN